MTKFYYAVCVFTILLINGFTSATYAQKKFVTNGQWYIEWGYNKEWYTNSDIHIDQPGLNSSFTFVNTQAHDHIGWDKVFESALSIPQYNYRLGYFFNEKQDWGLEINFDHTKYIVVSGASQQVSGTLKGRQVDSTFISSEQNLKYWLNNGANFLLFNIVKKFDWYHLANDKFIVSGLLKVGIGPVIPHVENTIFGNDNSPHFQFGGWNTGVEAGVRMVVFKHYFIDYSNKLDYARYSNLKVYEGTAQQAFATYEMILAAGVCF